MPIGIGTKTVTATRTCDVLGAQKEAEPHGLIDGTNAVHDRPT